MPDKIPPLSYNSYQLQARIQPICLHPINNWWIESISCHNRRKNTEVITSVTSQLKQIYQKDLKHKPKVLRWINCNITNFDLKRKKSIWKLDKTVLNIFTQGINYNPMEHWEWCNRIKNNGKIYNNWRGSGVVWVRCPWLLRNTPGIWYQLSATCNCLVQGDVQWLYRLHHTWSLMPVKNISLKALH